MTDKVVLAFSGGLDTSVCVKLLEEKYDYEVITACVDVGQGEEEMEKAKTMASEIGGLKHYNIDAKEEFANEYIARGIKANAEYEGYPLSTALARPLIAQKIIEVAEKEGAVAIAHGCTGKGNDQFRFEAVILAMSDLDIIAPIREMNLTRTGIKLNYDKIYSIDENLWGRAIEGDVLEDPANEPPEDIYEWTKSWEDANDEPEKVSIEFEEGIGEAAFYGPKVDIQAKNVYGKEDTMITIQWDALLAEQFDMYYIDQNGDKVRPYIIHRTSMGCYERTLAWLIEKYAGLFPTWLCPEQVRVLPISEKYNDYAEKVLKELRKNGISAEMDDRAEKIGYKIRETRLDRVPYMLVVGQKEEEEGVVSVRSRYLGDEGQKPLAEFISAICEEIRTKEIRKIEVKEENK